MTSDNELDEYELRSRRLMKDGELTADELVARLREELEVDIEELRVADEELRQSRVEAKIQLHAKAKSKIVQLEGLPYFETDLSGTIVTINREFADLVGRHPDFMVGKPVAALLAVDSRNAFRRSIIGFNGSNDFDAVTLRFDTIKHGTFECGATAARALVDGDVVIKWLLRKSAEADVRAEILNALTVELQALSAATVLSRQMLDDGSPIQDVLDRVASLAAAVIGADAVSINLMANKVGRAGEEGLIEFTRHQAEVECGPVWDAVNQGVSFRTDAVQADERWVPIHDAAADVQAQAIQVIPLRKGEDTIGSLTAYRGAHKPFSDDDEQALASVMESVLPIIDSKAAHEDALREAENLSIAISTRSAIEQAKGMIMCVEKCSEDEAFDRLKELSQHSNVKLRDLAVNVIERMSRPTG